MDAQQLKDANNTISLLGSRKKLQDAKTLFETIPNPNHHTYSAILNTLIKCGDLSRAALIFEELNKQPLIKEKRKIKLDVIICTTMMKGYCAIFDLNSALSILDTMDKYQPKITPNIRSLNTLLRGCVFVGDVSNATELISKSKIYEVELDSSCYEMYTSLLCQGLLVDIVFPMIGRIKDNFKQSLSILYYYLGRALFIKGNWKKMQKILNQSIASIECLAIMDSNDEADKNEGSSSSIAAATIGGKRSWSKSEDERRDESLKIYFLHKKKELQNDIDKLINYNYKDGHHQRIRELLSSHVLLFPYARHTESSSSSKLLKTDLIESLTKAIKSSYGMIDLEIETQYDQIFDDDVRLNFETFLKSSNNKVVKCEICSGNGDWICAQANADKNSLWVAIEIRSDRVYRTFTNAVINNVDNLIIIRGDANFLLQNFFAFESIDTFCINMPEPPQQRGNNASTDSTINHLLNIEFLVLLSKALKRKRLKFITIFTDNKWYGQFLVRMISEFIRDGSSKNNGRFRMKSVLPAEASNLDGTWSPSFNIDNIYLYSGNPGADCGYMVNAQSYFDLLKKQELQSDEKYFIVLQNS